MDDLWKDFLIVALLLLILPLTFFYIVLWRRWNEKHVVAPINENPAEKPSDVVDKKEKPPVDPSDVSAETSRRPREQEQYAEDSRLTARPNVMSTFWFNRNAAPYYPPNIVAARRERIAGLPITLLEDWSFLHPNLLEFIRKKFPVPSLTQRAALATLSWNRDTVIVSPRGEGKTYSWMLKLMDFFEETDKTGNWKFKNIKGRMGAIVVTHFESDAYMLEERMRNIIPDHLFLPWLCVCDYSRERAIEHFLMYGVAMVICTPYHFWKILEQQIECDYLIFDNVETWDGNMKRIHTRLNRIKWPRQIIACAKNEESNVERLVRRYNYHLMVSGETITIDGNSVYTGY